jgi:hypothetical protein
MAIGTPVSIATPAIVGGSAATSILTVSTAVSAGEHVILVGNRSGTMIGTTASDARGNTYQLDYAVDGTNGALALLSSKITTALQIGDLITITYPSSIFGTRMGAAIKCSGLAATGWYEDRSTLYDTAFSSTVVTAAKANVQADALLVGIAIQLGLDRTWTSNAPWTELLDAQIANDRGISMQAQVVSTVASRSTDFTASGSIAGVGLMAIYKGGGSGITHALGNATMTHTENAFTRRKIVRL